MSKKRKFGRKIARMSPEGHQMLPIVQKTNVIHLCIQTPIPITADVVHGPEYRSLASTGRSPRARRAPKCHSMKKQRIDQLIKVSESIA